jgi:hypothetical protein
LYGLLVAPDLQQQVTDLLGVFARAGWADGNVDIPFLNAGGLGILSGEGHLPNPGLERVLTCVGAGPAFAAAGVGGRAHRESDRRSTRSCVLIRRMSVENPLWGAPRIHGELLKLGFEVAQSSVEQGCAVSRPVQRTGVIRSRAILGGLHHRYGRI